MAIFSFNCREDETCDNSNLNLLFIAYINSITSPYLLNVTIMSYKYLKW